MYFKQLKKFTGFKRIRDHLFGSKNEFKIKSDADINDQLYYCLSIMVRSDKLLQK